MENAEPKFKAGTPEYDTDVIKRARKAATTIGKTLEHYRLIGEALSIMRKRAMKEAGLEGSNKAPSGPKYTKALNAELDKAPEFLAPEVFESGSARTHAVWLHDCAADVEWTFQVVERAKPGSTRRWNNPTYIWKQWRALTKEPSKKALDAKAKKEAMAKAQAEEQERYREEWREKYLALKAKYEALTGAEFENGSKAMLQAEGAAETYRKAKEADTLATLIANDPYREVEIAKPKPKRERKPRKTKAEAEAGGYAPGVLEEITGKRKRQKKTEAPLDNQEAVN